MAYPGFVTKLPGAPICMFRVVRPVFLHNADSWILDKFFIFIDSDCRDMTRHFHEEFSRFVKSLASSMRIRQEYLSLSPSPLPSRSLQIVQNVFVQNPFPLRSKYTPTHIKQKFDSWVFSPKKTQTTYSSLLILRTSMEKRTAIVVFYNCVICAKVTMQTILFDITRKILAGK